MNKEQLEELGPKEKQVIQNLILTALKEAYFRRAKKEKINSTPTLSMELDLLEIAITELTETIKDAKEN